MSHYAFFIFGLQSESNSNIFQVAGFLCIFGFGVYVTDKL